MHYRWLSETKPAGSWTSECRPWGANSIQPYSCSPPPSETAVVNRFLVASSMKTHFLRLLTYINGVRLSVGVRLHTAAGVRMYIIMCSVAAYSQKRC